jgi:hypothetical protein
MHSSSLAKTLFKAFTTTLFASVKKSVSLLECPGGVTGANQLAFEISLIRLELMDDVPSLVPEKDN